MAESVDQQENNINKEEKLISVQKKFRNLESDRRAYAEETVAYIRRQMTIIDKLNEENLKLKDLIAKLNNQTQKQTTAMSKTTGNTDNIVDELKAKIEEEKKKQDEIDKNANDFRKKIKEKKQSLGGINAGLENQTALSKQIKILENRLDKANQKFNEAIAINKNLRQTIDSLRRERVIFDNLYKKLEQELHEKRKEMANIIETANTAYEERDKANELIQGMKHQAKRESNDFEKDLRELSQIMEKNKKTLDYIKLTEKTKGEDHGGNNEADRGPRPQRVVRDKNFSQANLEKIQKYEEDFAKIQSATQIKDFEQLINIFVKNEEKNFTLFKYVNELSNDIEELEKTIAELKDEKANYEGQGSVDVQRKNVLKDLENKLQRSEHKSEQYEFKYHDNLKLINSLTNYIETLFNTIECDKALAKEYAGTHGVTDSNMMIFLGIIEDRVNQILQAYSLITAQKSGDHFQNLINKASNLSTQMMAQAKPKQDGPPNNEDIDEDDIESNKPLTLEEFRLRALEKLEKKQMPGNKNKIKTQSKGQRKVNK